MEQTTSAAARKPGFSLFGSGKQVPGDFWGGLAAMLVALPASIAFGVTVYAAMGPAYAAYGALAGIIGATVMGLVASTMGNAAGTLITIGSITRTLYLTWRPCERPAG